MEFCRENSMTPREQDARDYLSKHRILELLNNMTSQLVYHRPNNPKEFLLDLLKNLQEAKKTSKGHPCLFDEENIRSVFGILDPTKRGFITSQQYKEAMLTIGAINFEKSPSGHDVDKISQETFLKEAKLGLVRSSATFSNESNEPF